MSPVHEGPISAETISAGGGAPRSWDEERERLGGAGTYWLVTTERDGAPHLVPVLAVMVKGLLHFVANEGSRKARNTARDGRCAIGATTDHADFVIEGVASRIVDETTLRLVADAYAAKYDWHVTVRGEAFHEAEGAPTAGPPPYTVYQLRPVTAFAFGTVEPARSTRWRFATG